MIDDNAAEKEKEKDKPFSNSFSQQFHISKNWFLPHLHTQTHTHQLHMDSISKYEEEKLKTVLSP